MATDVEAQEALYSAVVKLADDAKRAAPTPASKLLVAAAIAYRAAEGGPQIGNVTFGE